MGRIRTIKPEFWASETLAKVSIRARMTFAGTWTYVDDNGVGRDNHCLIASTVYPLEADPREARDSTRDDLASLAEQGLIIRYIVDGRRYLKVAGWDEHQRIDRPGKPRYPQPDADGAQILTPERAHALDTATWPSPSPSPGPAAEPPQRCAASAYRRRTGRFAARGRRYITIEVRRRQRPDDGQPPGGEPGQPAAHLTREQHSEPAQKATSQTPDQAASPGARETVATLQRPEQGTGSREQGRRSRDQGASDTHSLIATWPPALPGPSSEPQTLPGMPGDHPGAVVCRPSPVAARHPSRPAAEVEAAFNRFWAAYPKRVAKQDARNAWNKIAKDFRADLDTIVIGAERYRDDSARRRAGDRYTAHPGTWLRAGRWLDELPTQDDRILSTADQRVRAGLAVAAIFAEREARGEI